LFIIERRVCGKAIFTVQFTEEPMKEDTSEEDTSEEDTSEEECNIELEN
jgi:hypothetical protein